MKYKLYIGDENMINKSVDLSKLDLETIQSTSEELFKLTLLDKGLITKDDLDKPLNIKYGNKGKTCKLIYRASTYNKLYKFSQDLKKYYDLHHKTDKNFEYEDKYLINYDFLKTEIPVLNDFVEPFLNFVISKHKNNKHQIDNVEIIKANIKNIKKQNNKTYIPREIIIASYKLFFTDFYGYKESENDYVFRYKQFRNFTESYIDFLDNYEKKKITKDDQKETFELKPLTEQEQEFIKLGIDMYGEVKFNEMYPPNSEEREMFFKYLEEEIENINNKKFYSEEELKNESYEGEKNMENNINVDNQTMDNYEKYRKENNINSIDDVLNVVVPALLEEGYNPINQILGYLMSGDPTYLGSVKSRIIMTSAYDRYEYIESLVVSRMRSYESNKEKEYIKMGIDMYGEEEFNQKYPPNSEEREMFFKYLEEEIKKQKEINKNETDVKYSIDDPISYRRGNNINSIDDVLDVVIPELVKEGYTPVNQITGYLMSGDPTYLSKGSARSIMSASYDVDEYLEDFINDKISGMKIEPTEKSIKR